MMRAFHLLPIALLAGCAATPEQFTEDEVARAAKVKAYSASSIAPVHEVIGPVRSNSCDSGSFERFHGTQGEAIWLLKLQAARLGGDLVVDYRCRTRTLDPISRCLESKRCEGQAAVRD